MVVYTEDLKKVTLNEKDYLNQGRCSKIYKEDNYIKKLYFDYCSKNDRISKEVYQILKDINSSNIIRIYELYYNYLKKEIKGYLADYYESEKMDILKEDINYTLNNIYDIKSLFEKLAHYNIKVNDLTCSNTIINKDKIILIDPDLYKIVDCSKEECVKYNNKELMNLFKSIYIKSLNGHLIEFKDTNPFFKLDELFTGNVEQLEKKLVKYKYPIEYFKSR